MHQFFQLYFEPFLCGVLLVQLVYRELNGDYNNYVTSSLGTNFPNLCKKLICSYFCTQLGQHLSSCTNRPTKKQFPLPPHSIPSPSTEQLDRAGVVRWEGMLMVGVAGEVRGPRVRIPAHHQGINQTIPSGLVHARASCVYV